MKTIRYMVKSELHGVARIPTVALVAPLQGKAIVSDIAALQVLRQTAVVHLFVRVCVHMNVCKPM